MNSIVGRLRESGAITRWAVITLCLVLGTAGQARAGSFIFAGEANGVDLIAHPTGYTGTGGVITVNVCIVPGTPNAAAMVTPTQHIVDTWNALVATTPNLFFAGSNNIPATDFDWESTAMHELGHCIGLGHPNLANESLLPDPDDWNYTTSTDGVNNAFDIDDGADNVRGSSDDVRGDDVNLHWFRIGSNNPFTIAPTVDSTTYTRGGALPGGHSFATNADRDVGALLGFADTEAVMQQGAFPDEDQRHLNHDDVATLSLGMSGLDMTAGNVDDYTVNLVSLGESASPSCNVTLDFDNSTSFAACLTGGTFINATHVRITTAAIHFNTAPSWFFNPTTTTTSTTTATTSTTLPPFAIDHFMLYSVKATVGTTPLVDKFVALGPVLLGDQFRSVNYNVTKAKELGLPADKNGGGVLDAATHLKEYSVKEASGTPRFTAVKDVGITNQCNIALRLEVRKPVSLMVPTNKSLVAPVSPPGATDVDHYLCYQAKPQLKLANGTLLPKFPRGLQVDVTDQFQTRRYDLKRITKLCNPVNKSGSPVYLAPPSKGSPASITPATIQNPTDHLVCYRAQLAKKSNAQTSCVPVVPPTSAPSLGQPRHTPVVGMYLNNQLGPERLNSMKEIELCIPSLKALLPP